MSVSSILKLIYPDKCPYCGIIINGDKECCDECIKNIKKFNNVRVIEVLDKDFNIDEKVECFSPFIYKSKVRKAICKFKFEGYKQHANSFSKSMFNEINVRDIGHEFDLITSVPMSKNRKRFIGYNQAKILGKKLSKRLNLPYKDLLIKIRENDIQHNLSAQERRKNVIGAYGIKDANDVKGKRILICDDIITTGSTLRENSLELFKAGAKSVTCVTIASAVID